MIGRALVIILAGWIAQGAEAAECRPDRVQLRGDWGEVAFAVELAETEATRAQGLMFRDHLPRNAGMLFVYEHPRRASFWMKNTFIPLDMIFADDTGTVRHVHHGAIPGDTTPIEGGEAILAVLEINAGLAARYGIAPGSVLRHPAFAPDRAAWPCAAAEN